MTSLPKLPPRATLIAAALNVLCPTCGEPQPNPDDGGDMWSTDEVQSATRMIRQCVSCEADFLILSENKVRV